MGIDEIKSKRLHTSNLKTLPRLFRRLRFIWSKWRHPGPVRPPTGWTLNNIPLELILDIAGYLAPETRAALALTSHTMLFKLGSGVLKLEEPWRYRLLELLEKDGVELPNILCSLCRMFHTSRIASDYQWDAGKYEGMRACEKWEPWTAQKIFSPSLPAHVHFNVVAAVMRCHRHSSTALRPGMLACSDILKGEQSTVQCHHDYRVDKGHLILKTERLILPGLDKKRCLEEIPKVTKLLEKYSWKLGRICDHTTWSQSYPNVFPAKGFTRTPHGNTSGINKSVCLWSHDFTCSRLECQTGVKKSTRETAWVTGCPYCYTDFTYLFFSLGDQGRGCCLTTWKDLGPGRDPQDREWHSHRYGINRDYIRIRGEGELGNVYKAFGEKSWDHQLQYRGFFGSERFQFDI